MVASLASVDTPRPHFGLPPSPHWPLLFAAPLIYNGMYHATKRPLSWAPFCVCPRSHFVVHGSFCRDVSSFFFPNSQRLWWWLSELCEGNYCKIPLQERVSPVGILLCGVMHNSGLCGGGQPCSGADQKQIEETEKPQCLPCSPQAMYLTVLPLTSVVICLTTLRLWARLLRCNDTDSYMIHQ